MFLNIQGVVIILHYLDQEKKSGGERILVPRVGFGIEVHSFRILFHGEVEDL